MVAFHLDLGYLQRCHISDISSTQLSPLDLQTILSEVALSFPRKGNSAGTGSGNLAFTLRQISESSPIPCQWGRAVCGSPARSEGCPHCALRYSKAAHNCVCSNPLPALALTLLWMRPSAMASSFAAPPLSIYYPR